MLTYSFLQCNKHCNCGCDYVYNVKSLHSLWRRAVLNLLAVFISKLNFV
jgi:hypothetical protein